MAAICRKTWFACSAAILVLSLLNPGATVAAEPAKESSVGDAALFDRLDANHDGSITANEVTAENRSLFDRLIRRGDTNHDQALSRQEFLEALVPTRPEKPIEAKEPTTVPGANAVRYLLLTMDKNRNARIEKDEVPAELKAAFDMMLERMDKNGNGSLERQELSRGGPALAIAANRYVQRKGIDVDAELAKLKKSEGAAYDRFEQKLVPIAEIRDPKQARQMFAQLDENGDGKLDPKEVPEPLQEPIARLVRIGDRDGDGKLSEDEFVAAAEQIARFMNRRQKNEIPPGKPLSKLDRKAKANDANSEAKN